MRKPAQVTREISLEEIKRREREVRDAGEKRRLMGIRLKLEGYSVSEIMRIMPVTQCTLLTWVKNFNESGFEGLVTKKPPGRKKYLDNDQLEIVRKWLNDGPMEKHDCCFWTGAKLVEAIEKEFGVRYSLNGMYDLLKDLNYCRKVVKTRHHKSDPEKAEEFKKNFRVWSRQ